MWVQLVAPGMEGLWLKTICVSVHWSSSLPFLSAFSWLQGFYLGSLFFHPPFQITFSSLFLLYILSAGRRLSLGCCKNGQLPANSLIILSSSTDLHVCLPLLSRSSPNLKHSPPCLTWKNETFKLLVKLQGKKNCSTLCTSLHHRFSSENTLLNSLLRVYCCHFTELLGDSEQWDAALKPSLQTSHPVVLASLLLVLIQAEEYKNTAVLLVRSCSLHQSERMAEKCWLRAS